MRGISLSDRAAQGGGSCADRIADNGSKEGARRRAMIALPRRYWGFDVSPPRFWGFDCSPPNVGSSETYVRGCQATMLLFSSGLKAGLNCFINSFQFILSISLPAFRDFIPAFSPARGSLQNAYNIFYNEVTPI